MCKDDFNYLAPYTIGGPTGDYILTPVIDSCQWAEYAVIAIAGGDTGPTTVVVSGTKPQAQSLKFDGTITLDNSTAIPAMVWRLGNNGTPDINPEYVRVSDSKHRVFIHIDAQNNQSCYVTIRYRLMPLKQVLGKVTTVHPEHEVQMNIAREHATIARLNGKDAPN